MPPGLVAKIRARAAAKERSARGASKAPKGTRPVSESPESAPPAAVPAKVPEDYDEAATEAAAAEAARRAAAEWEAAKLAWTQDVEEIAGAAEQSLPSLRSQNTLIRFLCVVVGWRRKVCK